MPSRLRRMLLVNTKTSGAVTSHAINQVDPRGGASITGENSVGKTTTLQLIPLFFGTLPNHIVEALGQREPMLDYVLPQPQSAIVFEYQRGNDEDHDIRCVILRRHADGGPRYRFYAGGFNAEHFYTKTATGERAFCDDAQMVDAMNASGSPASSQFGIADYRYVILGQRANKENYRRLREASARFSFASRSLTNMDRLIESAVKEQVSFKDFIQLASTIVQERMGGVATIQQRGKLALKQSRSQIEQWLEDREACERAFAMEPQIASLREHITAFYNTSSALDETKRDVAPLANALSAQLEDTRGQKATLEEKIKEEAEAIETEIGDLRTQVEAAQTALGIASSAVKQEKIRRDSLNLEIVAQWARDIETIPSLKDRLTGLAKEMAAATEESGNIESTYNQLIQEANTALTEEIGRIQEGWEAPQQELNEACRIADERCRERARELQTIQDAQAEDLTTLLFRLNGDFSAAKESLRNVTGSPHAIAAHTKTTEALNGHRQTLMEAITAESAARQRKTTRENEMHDARRALATARQRVQVAQEQLRKLNRQLNPQDGTLLAALRGRPDDLWKQDIARILDETLLERQDLNPIFETISDGTAFGLSLDTSQISAPAWADDAQLRQDIDTAEQVVHQIEEKSLQAQEALAKAEELFTAASAEHQTAETRLDALKGLTQARETAVDLSLQILRDSVDSAKTELTNSVRQLQAQIDEAQSQKKQLKIVHNREHADIQEEAREQKAEAQQRFQEARTALAARESAARIAKDEAVRSLTQQMNAALSDAGVDVNRLSELRRMHEDLTETVDDIESHRPVVIQWRAWLDEGGYSILKSLEDRLKDEGLALTRASTALTQREESARTHMAALTKDLAKIDAQITGLGDQLDILAALKERHGIPDRSEREAKEGLTAEGLRTSINTLLNQLEAAEGLVRNEFNRARNQITARPNAVRDLIENSLTGSETLDVASRASRLCAAHHLVAREILPNVVNSAESIVEHIRQFRQRIQSFEREVKTFNDQFQSGLDKIAGFKRIKDFKVQITTDFSKINFLKSLDLVDAVGRDQAFSRSINETPVLPGAKTAQALRNFSSLLKDTSTLEIELGRHITLRGSATVNDVVKPFANEVDLQHIASTGLNAIILITLLSGMLNMIRGDEEVYIPWVTDEVGKFDAGNFRNLMDVLRDNHIDVVTASPDLTIPKARCFNNRYIFRDRGAIARYADPVHFVDAADIKEPA